MSSNGNIRRRNILNRNVKQKAEAVHDNQYGCGGTQYYISDLSVDSLFDILQTVCNYIVF